VEQGSAYDGVYFVEKGLLSCIAEFEDGDTVGVGLIGIEGAVGVSGVLSCRPATHRAVARVETSLLRIDKGRFREFARELMDLRQVLDRYLDALVTSAELNVACFALHPLEARIGTSLLTVSDATGLDQVEGTHEQLASLFGVQRTSVTSLLGNMESAGLVTTSRGSIKINRADSLKEIACGCHGRQGALWRDLWGAD
jgi:CRP-like cAMP-binding protein